MNRRSYTWRKNEMVDTSKHHKDMDTQVARDTGNRDIRLIMCFLCVPSSSLSYLMLLHSPRAPRAFMSSKNAIYESSMLWGFGAGALADSCLTTGGVTAGWLIVMAVDDFGLGFGSADSLLTRTDAGTYRKQQVICWIKCEQVQIPE